MNYTFLFSSFSWLSPAHVLMAQMIALTPVTKARYFNQQENVQIPLPQHSPVRAKAKMGTEKANAKLRIWILHPKSMKQGKLKKLVHL